MILRNFMIIISLFCVLIVLSLFKLYVYNGLYFTVENLLKRYYDIWG